MPQRRFAAAVFALAATLVLAACMMMPGKFTSSLDLRRDGTYSFVYRGEIHMLAFSRLAQQQMRGQQAFSPAPCFGKDSGQPRECTREEVAEQRKAWEAERAAGDAKRRQEAETMKAMLGGIDMSDPRAADELVARLRKQAGWRKVENLGDGRFMVDFAIAGRLDHDFSFPTIERFPQMSPFVLVSLRGDGTVRVDAPAFSGSQQGSMIGPMMMGMGAAMSAADGGGKADPAMPAIDGRFTIATDGEVLANNTEEGAEAATTGRMLGWTITPRTANAPMAVIRLR